MTALIFTVLATLEMCSTIGFNEYIEKSATEPINFFGVDLRPFLREWRATNMIESEQNTGEKDFSREYKDSVRY